VNNSATSTPGCLDSFGRGEEQRSGLLIVTTTFPRWMDDPAPAPFVFHHARAMLDYFRVTVLAPHHPGAALQEDMDGVRVIRFRYGPDSLELLADGAGIRNNMRKGLREKLMAPALVAAEAGALRREIKSGGHQYINSHWLFPSGLLTSFLADRGMKHVITAHAADYDLLLSAPFGKTLIKYMAHKADVMVGVSSRLSAGLSSIAGNRGRIVTRPMGVDTAMFKDNSLKRNEWRARLGADRSPVVLFVGKLTPKKGVPVLLEAAGRLMKRGVDLMLVLAGQGELGHVLEEEAGKLGITNRTRFLGAVPNSDLPGLYAAADAVVVPSVMDPSGETEGMPVVILEALAAGRPVIATTLCSVPDDLVGKGVIEVVPQDPDGLATALMEALAGKVEVDAETVARYDVRKVADYYAGLFMEGR